MARVWSVFRKGLAVLGAASALQGVGVAQAADVVWSIGVQGPVAVATWSNYPPVPWPAPPVPPAPVWGYGPPQVIYGPPPVAYSPPVYRSHWERPHRHHHHRHHERYDHRGYEGGYHGPRY